MPRGRLRHAVHHHHKLALSGAHAQRMPRTHAAGSSWAQGLDQGSAPAGLGPLCPGRTSAHSTQFLYTFFFDPTYKKFFPPSWGMLLFSDPAGTMDGWMDYTSLCIDHGPLAGGISATRGGGLPVSTYNPRGAFVSSDHSLLSDNPDMPLLQGRWRFICSRCPSCRGPAGTVPGKA